jgi:peptidoglycan hydrolase FlgJ
MAREAFMTPITAPGAPLAKVLAAPAAAPAETPDAAAVPPERQAALRKAAQDFEASFLAEMLKAAGFGKPRESFGGGPGEEAFAGLLAREQAARLAAHGGIGLAEHVFRELLAREAARGTPGDA